MLFQVHISHIIKDREGDGKHSSTPFLLPPIEADDAEALVKWLTPFKKKELDHPLFPPCPPGCTHRHEFSILPMKTFRIQNKTK